jgi:toxin secretion/phage lysis holin
MEKTVIGSILGVLGAICGFLYGELNGLLIAVLVLMGVDYITGLGAASVRHELDSKIGWKGILKKACMLLILAVAHILDVYVLGIANIESDHAAIMTLVEFLYIGNEGLSILENAGKLGVTLPKPLYKVLVQLKDLGNGDKDKQDTPEDKDSQSEDDK